MHEPWWKVLDTKTLLIVGESTARQMFNAFVGRYVSSAAHEHLMTGRCNEFNAMDPRFASLVTNWRLVVHNCTPPVAAAAGIGCADCAKACRMPSMNNALDGWTDATATATASKTWHGHPCGLSKTWHGHSSTAVVRFSWKPELMTLADEVAFKRRLCLEQPTPDIVIVAKGLHDVYFKPERTPSAQFHHTLSAFENFTKLLECFPATTAIVVRAPLDGLRTSPDAGLSWGRHSETDYLQATSDALRAVTMRFARVRRGPVFFLDAFARTLHTRPNQTWVPCDGHHYPAGVHEGMWQEVADAYAYRKERTEPTAYLAPTHAVEDDQRHASSTL